jgi:hypothetical protein
MKYTDPQTKAMAEKPYLQQMYYGSNVHSGTGEKLRAALGEGRISYNASNGADFSFTMDDGSVFQVELSTDAGLNAHTSRYGGYGPSLDYVTYTPPWAGK